jgi:hypothetical protein
MKTLLSPPTLPAVDIEPVKVVSDSAEVACVYYGDAQLFEDCSTNPVCANYVGNFSINNPYSSTYNPGWKNHPNFSWVTAQN